MLTAYPRSIKARPADSTEFGGQTWIDLFDPTPEEIERIRVVFGVRVPTREDLSEIETTSRLRQDGDNLYMSAPLVGRADDGVLTSSPTGLILSQRICITVRFEKTGAIDAVAERMKAVETISAADVFARVLEEVVDRSADRLELSATTLNEASHAIFGEKQDGRSKLVRDTDKLRDLMMRTGRVSERMSHARYTLVCLGRIAQYVSDRGHGWLEPEILERLGAVKADIASLEQFEENLLSRIQLLQDAATAFISIEQNDVVKVLTIASVVGIPPVLVVGVYGMNFKYMPELNWAYGYPFALGLIVVSIAAPLIWFKIKDWM